MLWKNVSRANFSYLLQPRNSYLYSNFDTNEIEGMTLKKDWLALNNKVNLLSAYSRNVENIDENDLGRNKFF